MGKHFALTLQLPFYRSSQEKQKHFQQSALLRVLPVRAYYGLVLFAIITALAVGYLVQINSFSTEGYKITSLQNKISQLQNQNASLEIASAQLQSIQRVETDPSTYAMVPVTSVTYLNVQQPTMLSER